MQKTIAFPLLLAVCVLGQAAAPTAPAWAGTPAPPAFAPELEPMAGTWKRVKTQDKEKDTWLVIKNDAGKLKLKYSMPRRDKTYTSDWDGRLEVELQVRIKEIHEPQLSVRPSPPGILVEERIRYQGTEGGETWLSAVYELGESGKLLFRCLRIKQDKQEVACSSVTEYERVSDRTDWPK